MKNPEHNATNKRIFRENNRRCALSLCIKGAATNISYNHALHVKAMSLTILPEIHFSPSSHIHFEWEREKKRVYARSKNNLHVSQLTTFFSKVIDVLVGPYVGRILLFICILIIIPQAFPPSKFNLFFFFISIYLKTWIRL